MGKYKRMRTERQPLLPDTTNKRKVYTDERDMGQQKSESPIPPPKQANELILKDGEDSCTLYAYKESTQRLIIYWLLSVCTLGLYRLFAYWMKSLDFKVRFVPASHDEAEFLVIKDGHGTLTIKKIFTQESETGFIRPTLSGKMEIVHSKRFFRYRKIKYIWYHKQQNWLNPSELDSTAPFNIYKDSIGDRSGLKDTEVVARREIYNTNSLALKLTPLLVILFKEVLGPFYIFQAFSVTLWYLDQYAYYASVIVVITVGSAIVAVYEMRQQEKKVRKMVGDTINVVLRRNGKDIEVDATEIVPGDILVLPATTFVLPCDALIMNGSVIVNEAMLTGESVPVTKSSLKDADECESHVRLSSEHNRHTLFAGTTILQTRNYKGQPVLARVLRTGFSTLKGQLIRSIMYPKPQDPQHLKDIIMFIVVLGFIAGIGFLYTIALMIVKQEAAKDIIVRSLDIVTIVVPPALPAAMAIGTLMANRRLKAKSIYCMSDSAINVCGSINVSCFDKTGTLTEDGLDFNCLKAIKKNEKGLPVFTKEFENIDPTSLSEDDANLDIVLAAAGCHSLTRIDGVLQGDPLELILHEKSKWTIEEPLNSDEETQDFDNVQPTVLRPPVEQAMYHPENHEYSVIKQHPFNSALQRMSVIISTPSEHSAHEMMVVTKGSPEMIASLCLPETIPENYMDVIDEYAQRGYRLIAVASKKVHMNFAKALKSPRDTMESDLEYLGLFIMENRLKEQTLGVINELSVAKIRCVMVTGDNLLTAMSVARECGIIRPTKKAFLVTHSKEEKDVLGRTKLFIRESVSSSESDIDTDSEVRSFDRKTDLLKSKYQLAIAGPTYAVIVKEYPELVDRLAAVCDVYARMAPDQKAQMICSLQKIGMKVSMCGDGANDCSALKAADCGISLSEAEASIAAPFTSAVPDIRCVPEVIKEGRCALVTSYNVSKYMAAYSIEEFLSVMLLYWEGTNISDGQFFVIDFFLITVVALFIGRTGAAKILNPNPPPNRLATLAFYFSIFGQLILNIIFQVVPFLLVRAQSWYVPAPEHADGHKTMIGTTVFMASCCMYLGYAFVYSKPHPYRLPVYTNYWLCSVVLVLFCLNLVMIFANIGLLSFLMAFDDIPDYKFRAILFAISIVGIVLSILYEYYFVQNVVTGHMERKIRENRIRKNDPSLPEFEKILFVIGETPNWFVDETRVSTSLDRKETVESRC